MKKALVVFLALALVAGVFADEPVAESSIANFSGNASVTWGVDLDSSKTGFKNDAGAGFKVTLAKGGNKVSAGDGVWGEIKISTNGLAIDNSAIADGGAGVDYAKLHLGPLAIGIMKGDTKVGGYNAPRALAQGKQAKVDAVNESKEHGIVIQYSAGDIFSIDVDFRSAEKYNDDYGVAAEVTSKPISGLEIKAGYSMAFASNKMGLGAKLEYSLPIGGDGMYVKPGLGYSSTLDGDSGSVAVGLLFGFSGESAGNPGLPLFDDDIANSSNAGVSVATLINLNDTEVIPLFFDVWTGSNLVPNFGAAAFFRTDAISGVADNFIAGAGLKYAISADPATITPQAGFILENTVSTKLKAGVVIGGAVANTEFSLWYTSGNLKDDVLGTVDFTVKISI